MNWEDICSRCALCCHEKVVLERVLLLDPDRACEFLSEDGLCSVYSQRFRKCDRCRKVNLYMAMFSPSLPETCSYVRWARAHHIRFCKRRELVLTALDE